MSAQEQHLRPNPNTGLHSATADRAGANWSRGFFRLWLVLAVLWVIALALLSQPWNSFDALMRASPARIEVDLESAKNSENRLLTADEMDAVLIEAMRQSSVTHLTKFASLAILPPAVILALGASLGWALRGFRREGR